MRPTLARLVQAVPDAEIPEWLRANRSKLQDRRLTHVTSPRLCDDVLQVLKQSLPQPHACDILDLNPGPCLWSRKLHDLLKPRRHILVEPRHDVFEPFIQPLLENHDSAYRLAPDLPTALDPKRRLLSEETYDFQKNLGKDGSSEFVINKNLLVVANLSGSRRKAPGFSGSQAKQFLNDYYRAVFVKEDYLHRYGLVHLLAWVGEDSHTSVLPKCVHSRTKQSIQLETTCKVESVAGPSQFLDRQSHQLRWSALESENQAAVRKSQKQNGIPVPPNRDQPEPLPSLASLEPRIEEVRANKDRYPFHQTFIQRLLQLDDQLVSEMPDWYAKYHTQAKKGRLRGKGKGGATPNMTTYRIMMTELRVHHNTYLKAKDFIWETRKLFRKLQDAWNKGWFSKSADPDHAAQAADLVQENAFMQKRHKEIKRDTRLLISKAIDDYRCYDVNPKVMSWNCRHHDPLLVEDAEFFPKTPLTLIDFVPNPDIRRKLDTLEKQICYDYVCTTLMTYTSDSVMQAIKRIVPAGYEQFLEKLPELNDINRGGWMNLDDINIRTLHHDFLVAIALAFHNWPHRPAIEKLMAVHKSVYDEGPL